MNTVLVWVLVSVGGYNVSEVVYSPPMQDEASCEIVQKTITDAAKYNNISTRCVQIKMMVAK